MALAPLAAAQDEELDLTTLSLEDLMRVKVQVTSASKKPQDLLATPAAIFVLTAEDIRRSGVNSIPEALRMVPGLHVAQAWSHTWDIAARGFNSGFSDKLLVLIDGRSVYTPLFAGVWWDVQDTLIEDIDRIEVIRGPGASVWGANAVNGVINIITKPASETQGTLVTAETGTQDDYVFGARHGSTFGETGSWRAYARGFGRDALEYDGEQAYDDWWQRRAGFRADMRPRPSDTLTFQGDIYEGREGYLGTEAILTEPGTAVVDVDERVGGGNLSSLWTRELAADESVAVQLWYDRTERDNQQFGEHRDTLDVELKHHIELDGTHDVVWGAGWRGTRADYDNTDQVSLQPDPQTLRISNVFVQDEIAIVPGTFSLTLGSKFEHNSYTGWELQPTARFAWTPDHEQLIWGAVSRAVRTPSSVERDGYFAAYGIPDDGTTGYDTLVAFVPGRDFDSERVYAYELGWRSQVRDDLFLDIATYYNDYANLGTEEAGTLQSTADPTLFIEPLVAMNGMSGIGRGVELAAEWDVRDDWELALAYSYQELDLDVDDASTDAFSESIERDVPRNIFHLRSHHELTEELELTVGVFYVDSLDSLDVDSYWRGDVRLGWRPDERTQVSFGVRNLFHGGEQESEVNEVQTEAYVRASYRF